MQNFRSDASVLLTGESHSGSLQGSQEFRSGDYECADVYHWVSNANDVFEAPVISWNLGPNLEFGNSGKDAVAGPGRTNFKARQDDLPRFFQVSKDVGRIIMRVLAVLAIAAWMFSARSVPAAEARDGRAVPILFELFTSEGCSSCPPADAWLQQLDSSQPIPGVQAIVLSEHVDYWNHDGWKDPYSSSMLTERQDGYVHNLGLNTPSTPQVIVDGQSELKLNDPKQISQVVLKAEKAPQVPINISAMSVEGSSPAVLRASVKADGSSDKRNADIFAAVALDRAESQVLRGENGGRHLSHVAVVEQLVKIGKLEKGKTFDQNFQINLKPGLDSENLRLIVFVQEADYGDVLGSALQKNGTSSK